MLKELYIDNFKALNDFSIPFSKLTVLIGANSSGKSTILQVIDLMRAFVAMDLDTYFKEKGWKFSEIRSQLKNAKSNRITIKAKFDINVDNDILPLTWKFVLAISNEDITVDEEQLIDDISQQPILLSTTKELKVYYFDKSRNVTSSRNFSGLSLKSSFLRIIDDDEYRYSNPAIYAFKKYISQIDNFEALNPERIRSGNRGTSDNIGIGGEKLFSYIKSLRPEKRKLLETILKNYISNISGLDAVIKGRPGWIELVLREKYDAIETKISSRYISDGTMRFIALISIAIMSGTESIILLDEIEDGINPYLVSKVVDALRGIIMETNKQIIVTTHSAVMLNYFDSQDIVFIWRENNGQAKAKMLFSSEEMKKTLEYMNPGEVWLNYSQNKILEKMNSTISK